MTRITRHIVTTDDRGRVLGHTVERLLDDGRGETTVVRRSALTRCPMCRRIINAAQQVTGRCDCCGAGPMCNLCAARCRVCNRCVCRRCRRGFVWGQTPITACRFCFRRLNRRAIYEQELARRQRLLQQAALRERDLASRTSLRLQAARLLGRSGGTRGSARGGRGGGGARGLTRGG